MSNESFPTFAGLDVAVTRTTIHASRVQTSAGGVELRSQLQVNPRYRYRLKVTVRKNAPGAVDELAQLHAFIVARAGRADSFFFTDPIDGVSRRVRFDTDEQDLERVVPASNHGAWWSAPLVLISVKAAS